jgi:hypothetical protein
MFLSASNDGNVIWRSHICRKRAETHLQNKGHRLVNGPGTTLLELSFPEVISSNLAYCEAWESWPCARKFETSDRKQNCRFRLWWIQEESGYCISGTSRTRKRHLWTISNKRRCNAKSVAKTEPPPHNYRGGKCPFDLKHRQPSTGWGATVEPALLGDYTDLIESFFTFNWKTKTTNHIFKSCLDMKNEIILHIYRRCEKMSSVSALWSMTKNTSRRTIYLPYLEYLP